MRVPNLDWLPDLFADVVPDSDGPVAAMTSGQGLPAHDDGRLWPDMRRSWTLGIATGAHFPINHKTPIPAACQPDLPVRTYFCAARQTGKAAAFRVISAD